MSGHLIAFNCEVCGTKTYCEEGKPYECANKCAKKKSKKEPVKEPAKATEGVPEGQGESAE